MSEEGQGQGFSAWGWIGKAKAAVQDASSKIQENVQVPPAMGGIGGVFDKIMSMEDAATADESDYLPWATPPPKWVAKPLEWEALSKGLVENEATFLIGPERGLTKLEVQTLKLQGVVVSFDTAVAKQMSDRISPEILEYEPVSDMRFKLVPKHISEEKFWTNYFWKLCQVGETDNAQIQCRALLRVLNVLREDFPSEGRDMKLFAGLDDRAQMLQRVDALVTEVSSREEEREEYEEGERARHEVRDLYEEGCEALKMLEDCIQDTNMTDHLDMMKCFYDTCVSCRTRLQEEVDGGSERAQSTGADFSKLVALVTQLDTAIADFDARVQGKDSAAPRVRSPKPSAIPSPPPVDDDDDDSTKPLPPTAAPSTAAVVPGAPADVPEEEASVSADSFVHVSSSVKSRQSPANEHQDPEEELKAPAEKKATDFTALPWDTDED